ncbi:MAG: hypothetical protein E7329_11435 [Clostridiales bacterium]|nr:hypothetical protein [Clostridiales bacterium]
MDTKNLFPQDMTAYQSIPFWSWNDELEPQELRRQIRDMKKAGIGGFFMHARGGLTTPYMGEKWMEATAACIDEAEKQGMDAWCYDENGWPSGFAGMKLLEDPENLESFLVYEKLDHFDESALAVYLLEGDSLRRILGPADAKAEYHTLYEKKNSSVVDILNPEIVDKFIVETHEKYYARFGKDFGRVMKGFFTDEPQYFRWDTAYTPVMQKEYQKLYRADLLDELGALFVDCRQAKRLRYRYWKLMNDLYTENFAKKIFDWCTQHNCQLTGHTIIEETLFGQMACCAGVMPFYQYEHKPGIDWLGRKIRDEITPRQVSSVAQQLGKKHVLTETFACAGWDVNPRELKRIAEFQYVHGVNQMCQHLYPYSIRGQRKRDYPAFYSRHNSWTKPEDFKHFNDYFTRLGYLLSESQEAADVGVIHPIHSAYFTFNRNDFHSCDSLNNRFSNLVESLGKAQIGHHYLDETLLAQHGSVQGNALVMGKCAYHYVVIPEMEGLDASTVALLKKFMEAGGKIYLQGEAPHLMDGEEANLSFLKSNVSFEEMLPIDYRFSSLDTEIRSTFRRGPFGSFLYAVNLSESTEYTVSCSLAAKGAILFNLETGTQEPLFYEEGQHCIHVSLTFSPGKSYVIFLDNEAKPAFAPVKPVWKKLPLEGNIVAQDENILTVDYAALSLDGVSFGQPMHVMAVSDQLLRGKTNRTIWLKYSFTVAEIPASLRLECEAMGARKAWLNGKKLSLTTAPDITFDPAFLTCDIVSMVKEGANEIVFEIDYDQPEQVYQVFNGVYYEHSDGTETLLNCLSYRTDIEAIYLRGAFGVKTGSFTQGAKHTLITADSFSLFPAPACVSLDHLVESGFPFFGGKITVSIPFEAKGDETTLRLQGRYAIAKVSINGQSEKMVMMENTSDISGLVKPGKNELVLTVYTSYRNVFGPFHHAAEPEPFGVGPGTFSRYGTWQEGGVSDQFVSTYAFVNVGLSSIEIA